MNAEAERLSADLKTLYGSYEPRADFLSRLQGLLDDQQRSERPQHQRELDVRRHYPAVPWIAAGAVGVVLLAGGAVLAANIGRGSQGTGLPVATPTITTSTATITTSTATITTSTATTVSTTISPSRSVGTTATARPTPTVSLQPPVTVSGPGLPSAAMTMLVGWQQSQDGVPYARGYGYSTAIQSVMQRSPSQLDVAVFGPAKSIDQACGMDFTVHAAESPDAVVLYVTARLRPNGRVVCLDSNTTRHLEFKLASPLGNRTVLDLITGNRIPVGK
jgi:hypothetical protein